MSEIWKSIDNDTKISMTHAYLVGYIDGSKNFVYIYKKVFNENMEAEKIKEAEKFLHINFENIKDVNDYILKFVEYTYKMKKYANSNFFELASIAVTCYRGKIKDEDCLKLFDYKLQ